MDQAGETPRTVPFDLLSSVVLDLALLAAWYWLVPPLAGHLATPHWSHPLVIIGAYLAMCGGLNLAKRIAPRPGLDGENSFGLTSGCALGLAIPFTIFVITLTIITSGILDDGSPWQLWMERVPGGEATLSVLGILGFITVLGLFPTALLASPRPTMAAGSPRAAIVRALALLLGNLMVLVTAAFWQGHLAGSEPMGLALGGRLLVFVLAYAVFVMFYLPPRLAVAVIDGNRNSLWTLLVALALVIWPLTA